MVRHTFKTIKPSEVGGPAAVAVERNETLDGCTAAAS
jgi:hypothetical protein